MTQERYFYMKTEYYTVQDDVEQECLDCGFEATYHDEHHIAGQEEAEVVCPNCKSYNYFLKD